MTQMLGYREEWLQPDATAGLPVAAVFLPAAIAGLPVQVARGRL